MDIDQYVCLSSMPVSDGNYELDSLRKSEMECVRLWRNSQIEVLRQSSPLSKFEQENYYLNSVLPDKLSPFPSNILLSIRRLGVLIGYGGLVHIDWTSRQAEVSFLLSPEIMKNEVDYEDAFKAYLTLVGILAKEILSLNELNSETYEFRKRHIELIEFCGFTATGFLEKKAFVNGQYFRSILHTKRLD